MFAIVSCGLYNRIQNCQKSTYHLQHCKKCHSYSLVRY